MQYDSADFVVTRLRCQPSEIHGRPGLVGYPPARGANRRPGARVAERDTDQSIVGVFAEIEGQARELRPGPNERGLLDAFLQSRIAVKEGNADHVSGVPTRSF